MGLYLEDFEINRASRTRGRTVNEGDVSLFAGLVGEAVAGATRDVLRTLLGGNGLPVNRAVPSARAEWVRSR